MSNKGRKVTTSARPSMARPTTAPASTPTPTQPLDAAAAVGLAWLVWRLGLSPTEVQTVVLRKKTTAGGGS